MSGARRPRAVGVELVQDLSRVSSPIQGFLRRYRHRAKTRLDDGTRTDVYMVDYVDREETRRDAVAVVPYALDVGAVWVLLRRQFRYAAHVATGEALILEAVAGIIEADESPAACASRELEEEAALVVAETAVDAEGAPFFPAPGILTERIFPFTTSAPRFALERALEADPALDGSPLEEGAEVVLMPLADALAATTDGKTAVILHRLERRLRGAS